MIIYSGDEFVRLSLFHSVKKLVTEAFHYPDLNEFGAHIESINPNLIILDLKNTDIDPACLEQLALQTERLLVLYLKDSQKQHQLVTQALDSMIYPLEIGAFKNKVISLKEKL